MDRDKFNVIDKVAYQDFISKCFSMKRKTLINSSVLLIVRTIKDNIKSPAVRARIEKAVALIKNLQLIIMEMSIVL